MKWFAIVWEFQNEKEVFLMKRILALILILALLGCSHMPKQSNPFHCSDCNIILIFIDDLRADHLSMFGYYRNTTPFIDSLANASVVFEHAYVQGTYTYTSVPSILTSQMPTTLFGTNKDEPLTGKALTIAEILNQAGYKTVAFTGGIYFSHEFNIDQGFDLWVEDRFLLINNYKLAEAWLKNHTNSKFFMVIHGMELHDPVNKGHRYFALNISSRINGCEEEWGKLEKEYFKKGYINLTDDEIAKYTAMYDDNIRWVDNTTRKFFDFLAKKGLLTNTIVVVTSDHGEELLDHGGIQHGYTLYNEVLRVPLIIRFPSKVGLKYTGNVRLVDLVPTLLDAVGINYKRYNFVGQSLLDLLVTKTSMDLVVFSETNRGKQLRSIIKGDLKVIEDLTNNKTFLFNLSEDYEEKTNICWLHKELCQSLKEELHSFFNSLPIIYEPEEHEISEKLKSRLKSMGYLR